MKEGGGPKCVALVGTDSESIFAIVEGSCDFAVQARKVERAGRRRWSIERTIMVQREVGISLGLTRRDHRCK